MSYLLGLCFADDIILQSIAYDVTDQTIVTWACVLLFHSDIHGRSWKKFNVFHWGIDDVLLLAKYLKCCILKQLHTLSATTVEKPVQRAFVFQVLGLIKLLMLTHDSTDSDVTFLNYW